MPTSSNPKRVGVPFVRFLINYLREKFDENDSGERVAYFELFDSIDEKEIREILHLYSQRGRWSEYPDFLIQLAQVRDLGVQELRIKRPKRGRFDSLFVWRMSTLKFIPTRGYLANSLSVENLPQEMVPRHLESDLVRFRHLRQDARKVAAQRFLEAREG